jgi:AcrR family transcriptional regulator
MAAASGLSAVSMRAVASELGTTASTLYHYVASRDELLDLMVDTTMAGFATKPRPGRGWLHELVRLAEAMLQHYIAQPWLLDVPPARSVPGPNTLQWFELCLRAMQALDRPTRTKMETIGVLTGVTMLFARNATAPATLALDALDPARHPLLATGLAGMVDGQPDERLFQRTIRAVLIGLIDDRRAAAE